MKDEDLEYQQQQQQQHCFIYQGIRILIEQSLNIETSPELEGCTTRKFRVTACNWPATASFSQHCCHV